MTASTFTARHSQLNIFDYSLSRLIELDQDIRQRNLEGNGYDA
ncbi:MAG: hypothetical protein ACLTW9_10890 [Enterocloster sp.]